MESHRLALPVGFHIEHYRIEALLGRGGFALTYLATDPRLGKKVAIKELLPDTIATRIEGFTIVPHSATMKESWEWARDRFLEEARALATFSHPAIGARLIDDDRVAVLSFSKPALQYLDQPTTGLVFNAQAPLAETILLHYPQIEEVQYEFDGRIWTEDDWNY